MLGPTEQLRAVIRQLPTTSIAHVHTCFSAFTEAAMTLLSEQSIPFVFTPHGKLSPGMLANQHWAKAAWWRVRAANAVAKAEVVSALSEQEATYLRGKRLKRITVVPNGFDPERSTPKLDESTGRVEPYILFLGYLDPRKQPEFLVEAFARARIQKTHRLVFAGPDSYDHKRNIECVARKLGVSERVHFTGPVYGEEKWRWFRNADCLCLPSKGEGLPVVLVESLGAGTPVVFSRACNFDQIEQIGAGVCVDDFDVGQWAAAIDEVCTVPGRRDLMGVRALEMAKQYTWEAIMDRWLSVYENVLAGNQKSELQLSSQS